MWLRHVMCSLYFSRGVWLWHFSQGHTAFKSNSERFAAHCYIVWKTCRDFGVRWVRANNNHLCLIHVKLEEIFCCPAFECLNMLIISVLKREIQLCVISIEMKINIISTNMTVPRVAGRWKTRMAEETTPGVPYKSMFVTVMVPLQNLLDGTRTS